MGQDLSRLYGIANQFIGSQKALDEIHRLPRYADRAFATSDVYERYGWGLKAKIRRWKPETLGRIISYGKGTADEKKSNKAGPPRPAARYEIPRTSFFKARPDVLRGSDMGIDTSSGTSYLVELASWVIVAAMHDILHQHATKLDEAKGVHVLDMTEEALKSWVDGDMDVEDLKNLVMSMHERGQTSEACAAAWAACLARNDRGVRTKEHAEDLVSSTALDLWREGY